MIVEIAAIAGSIGSRSARNMLRVSVELAPPPTNSATITSSNDARNDSSAADTTAKRICGSETDPAVSGPPLHADLVKIFPALADVRITHSWCGFVAYTFDELAHVGRHEGVHYATGYCGSGVGMGGYLGTRIGQQVLGLPEGRTAFDGLPFSTRPPYTGTPWFLAPAVRFYRWRDRLPLRCAPVDGSHATRAEVTDILRRAPQRRWFARAAATAWPAPCRHSGFTTQPPEVTP